MRKITWIFFLCAFLLLNKFCSAQDLIIRTNNDTMKVKVLEVGADKIKFRRWGVKTGPPLEIYKNYVKEIIFENGTRVTVLYDLRTVSPDLTIKAKTHGLKIDLIAPILNHITL